MHEEANSGAARLRHGPQALLVLWRAFTDNRDAPNAAINVHSALL